MTDIKFEVLKKVAETRFKYKNLNSLSNLDSTSPPSIFIGSKLKYSQVNVGILSPLERDENAWIYDDEKYWAEKGFEIKDILKLRENLLNSRFKSNIYDSRFKKKFVELIKEIAISSRPVDVEIELKNRLRIEREKDKILTPLGMNANLKNAKLVSNVKVDTKLDKIMNDEIKASEGINLLYKNNFDVYSLSRILSVGVLGLSKNKKLVPTRWSITATDDTIGKNLTENIKEYSWLENYELSFGEFLGNQYLILFIPNVWNFELFEIYLPKSSWNSSSEIKAATDFENYYGRKRYAFNTGGGYYATRLSILEYLNKIKRQASVLVIRIETSSYWASLGVWVVRESVKKALENIIKTFESKEEILKNAKEVTKLNFNFDCSELLKRSVLLKQIKEQKNLREWF
jgi:DNA repair protein NreA